MIINNKSVTVPPLWRDASLLSFLRDHLGLTGSKYGCGKGYCGACTVHVNGQAARACVLPLSALGSAHITTIEGLAENGHLHPVQRAWIEGNVPQCGYCQPGQLMSAAALLTMNNSPSEADIVTAMSGNLCRCGAYGRIRAGVRRAAELAAKTAADS